MYIERKDIRAMHRLIAEKMSSGKADTVMVQRNGYLQRDYMHFCSGPDDWQLFMHTEPNAHSYEAVATRALYKLLLAIDKGRLPAREVVYQGIPDSGIIDISSMLDDRAIIKDLYMVMGKLDWSFLVSEDERFRIRGYKMLDEVNRSLELLCKDQYGISVAKQLWSLFNAPPEIESPELTLNGATQWYLDNQLRSASIGGLEATWDHIFKWSSTDSMEQKDARKLMPALGSLLNFSDKEQFFAKGGEFMEESQKFGKLGKPDFIDVRWRLHEGRLTSYEATLRKHIDIPAATIAGVDLPALENRMRRVDWRNDYFPADWRPAEHDPIRSLVNGIAFDLNKLREGNDESHEVLDKIALKYLVYTANEHVVPHLDRLKAGYERRLALKPDQMMITVLQAYNLLDGRAILKNIGAGQNQNWEWYAINPARRKTDGSSVIEKVPGAATYNPGQDFAELGAKDVRSDDRLALHDGSKIMTTLEIDGVKATRVIWVDPFHHRLLVDKEEGEHYGFYKVPDEVLYRSRVARADWFLPELQAEAESLGLSGANIARLSEDIIVRQKTSSLTQDEVFDQDRASYTIDIAKNFDGTFHIDQVRLELRLGIHPTIPVINGVDVQGLEKQIQSVDWKQDFTSILSAVYHSVHPGGDKEMQERVDRIYADLRQLRLGPNPEGREVAEALRLFYLKDTPNEVPGSALLGESRERELIFYFPARPVFSFEGLYNLVNSRFAVGFQRSAAGELEGGEWYRLNLRRQDRNGGYPFLSVPTQFSIQETLRSYDLAESRFHAFTARTVEALSNGNCHPVHLSPNAKFDDPVYIYAHPGVSTLMVDWGHTLLKAGYPKEAREQQDTRIPLGKFIKIVERVRNIQQAIQAIKKALPSRNNDEGQDRDETNRSRKR